MTLVQFSLTVIVFLSTHQTQQDYGEDEIDLLGDEHLKPKSAQLQPPKASTSTSHADLTTLSEISLADDEETVDTSGDHSRSTLPPSVSDLALDSAAKEIHRLEGELKKVSLDRDHWKTLAKQVGTF